nr:integrase, catalytic region, zinc finger, CCHC-type, peptidase aspartic, catalytic [Tanacetum cinerariifolium]
MGKSKKKSYKPKSEDTNQEKIYLLHMDFYGPMRVEHVNGKKYILVIIDDYSRFTWVKCLRSKDEASYFIIKFLKMIQVRLKVPVRRIRTDNETEFVNQNLREYYEQVGISHETSVARSPHVDHPAPDVIAPIVEVVTPELIASTSLTSSTTVHHDAPSPKEDNHDIKVAHMSNDLYFGIPIPEATSDQSSSMKFERLEVWELVPRPDKVMVITLKWIYKVKLDELG